MASFIIAAAIFMAFISTASAYDHLVGSSDGWVPNPKVAFNTWAEKTRFQINDKLVFKYKAGDSVLVVNKQDYDSCNVKSPIQKLEGGNSVFTFDRSGPYYFISGVEGNCAANGEKLVVVVLSARGGGKKPTPQPPTTSPPSPISPASPAPSVIPPTASPPAISPSVSPPANAPAMISPGPSSSGFSPGPAPPASSTPGENSSSSGAGLARSGVGAVLMAVVLGHFILG